MLHPATWRRLGAPAFLLLIFLAAAWLRVTHHDWDQDQRFVADEFLVTQTNLDRAQLPPGFLFQTSPKASYRVRAYASISSVNSVRPDDSPLSSTRTLVSDTGP